MAGLSKETQNLFDRKRKNEGFDDSLLILILNNHIIINYEASVTRRKRRRHFLVMAKSTLNIPDEPYYLHPNRFSDTNIAFDYWNDDAIFIQQFRLERAHFIILADKLRIPGFIQVGK